MLGFLEGASMHPMITQNALALMHYAMKCTGPNAFPTCKNPLNLLGPSILTTTKLSKLLTKSSTLKLKCIV